jgi:hypothetical protein
MRMTTEKKARILAIAKTREFVWPQLFREGSKSPYETNDVFRVVEEGAQREYNSPHASDVMLETRHKDADGKEIDFFRVFVPYDAMEHILGIYKDTALLPLNITPPYNVSEWLRDAETKMKNRKAEREKFVQSQLDRIPDNPQDLLLVKFEFDYSRTVDYSGWAVYLAGNFRWMLQNLIDADKWPLVLDIGHDDDLVYDDLYDLLMHLSWRKISHEDYNVLQRLFGQSYGFTNWEHLFDINYDEDETSEE